MKNLLLAAVCTAALSGCAANQAARQAQIDLFNKTIPHCKAPAECDAMWEAAQVWISMNGQMKIQNVTNVLIDTYNSPPNSPTLAMKATKMPSGNGSYRIVFEGGCNNMFGCIPTVWEAGVRFNDYVNTAGAVQPAS